MNVEHPSLLESSPTSASPSASLTPSTGMSTTTVLMIILFALLGVFIFLKIQPYLSFLTSIVDFVRNFMNGGVNLAAATTKNMVDQTADGTNVVVNKVSGKKKKQTIPEPDDTTSNVQTKGAYCYVGEWKGVRSCVKVKDKCESGKTFESEEKCVHPELR
jgi:hypothetical protein